MRLLAHLDYVRTKDLSTVVGKLFISEFRHELPRNTRLQVGR